MSKFFIEIKATKLVKNQNIALKKTDSLKKYPDFKAIFPSFSIFVLKTFEIL